VKTPAIKCNSESEVMERGVGAFFINRARPDRPRIFLWIPGDSCPANLPCWDTGSNAWWTLSGTDDKPTLSPSILSPNIWHGYLTNGEFTPC